MFKIETFAFILNKNILINLPFIENLLKKYLLKNFLFRNLILFLT